MPSMQLVNITYPSWRRNSVFHTKGCELTFTVKPPMLVSKDLKPNLEKKLLTQWTDSLHNRDMGMHPSLKRAQVQFYIELAATRW